MPDTLSGLWRQHTNIKHKHQEPLAMPEKKSMSGSSLSITSLAVDPVEQYYDLNLVISPKSYGLNLEIQVDVKSVRNKSKGSITPHRTSRCCGPPGPYMPFALISASRRSGGLERSFRTNDSLNPFHPNPTINPASRHQF
ncbi:MAG: hypothetical protein VCA38_18965 [Roseibacillus sp.]